MDTHIGERLVEALREDPVWGWQQVIAALPAFGLTDDERRGIERAIRDLIRLRKLLRRAATRHP